MLRKIATGVFVLCLTAWCGLALVLCMTIIGHGFSNVGPKLLHLAGTTNPNHDRRSGHKIALSSRMAGSEK